MLTSKRSLFLAAGIFAIHFASALTPRAASADDAALHAAQPGVTFGGRATYFKPEAADGGTLSGGAQLRFHCGCL